MATLPTTFASLTGYQLPRFGQEDEAQRLYLAKVFADINGRISGGGSVQVLATAPTSPVSGQEYYDTTLGQFGIWTGSTWWYAGKINSVTAADTTVTVVTTGNSVTVKAAQMAANSIKGNNTGVTANGIDLTAAQTKALLAIANTDVSGLGTFATQNYATPPAIGATTPNTITGTTVSATTLQMTSVTSQKLNMYSTLYGLGIQSSCMYHRSDGGAASGFNHAWYSGGTHSNTQGDPGAGGVTLQGLNKTGQLQNNGVFSLSESAVTVAASSTATLDFSANSTWALTISGTAVTLAISNNPPGVGRCIIRIINNSANGSPISTWPATFKFAGGVKTDMGTAAGTQTLLACYWDGTEYLVTGASGFA